MLSYLATFEEFWSTFWSSLVLWYSGFLSGFSNMVSINLGPQPSGLNQDSEERNQVVLQGQGPQRD